MHKALVNRLGGLSLPRKSVVRLTDRPDMASDVTVDVNNKTTTTKKQQQLFGGGCGGREVCVCGVVERGCSYIRKFCTV